MAIADLLLLDDAMLTLIWTSLIMIVPVYVLFLHYGNTSCLNSVYFL